MHNCIIGIDPGKHAGIAVVTVEEVPFLLWQSEVCCDGSALIAESSAINRATDEALNNGYHIVKFAIEDQFIGPNKRSGLSLARRAGRWWGIAELYCNNCCFVMPRAWQSILKAKNHGTKSASIAYALDNYMVRVSSDVADAIGIATYSALKLHRKNTKGK